jgi:hypothetical protein
VTTLPPAVLAHFDQGYQQTTDLLDDLIKAHEVNLGTERDRVLSIVAQMYSATDYAEWMPALLAVAVDRLARAAK